MKTKTILLLTMAASSLSVLANGSTMQTGAQQNQNTAYVQGIDNIKNFNTSDSTAKDTAVISLDSLSAMVKKAEATTDDALKQSEQNVLWALGIALVALLVAIGALMKAHKAASALQQLKEKGPKEHTDTKDQLSGLIRKVEELSQEKNNQGKRINELTKELERLQKAQASQSQPGFQSQSQPALTTEEKKYAWNVTNNSFGPSDCTTELNPHTMAILTCRSNGRGTFVINSAPEVQNELLYNAERGFKLIADIVKQKPSPTRIVTLSPGEIKLQNGSWVVTRKAKIALE